MSIKTKTTMTSMKQDMAGAAGMLSSFYTLVKSGFSQNLHCLLCIAENAVSPKAKIGCLGSTLSWIQSTRRTCSLIEIFVINIYYRFRVRLR
ncbi:Leucine aminopeptidase 1 [Toxocara canis]|uniref:Leucine aminopeptidase 1 n=1 Tax=Toxocara canis TaxID=6265 RepID=A0A0B2VMG3_TOXCA|nr:Leucine aminopeptidase 1 [Toxocara canis]